MTEENHGPCNCPYCQILRRTDAEDRAIYDKQKTIQEAVGRLMKELGLSRAQGIAAVMETLAMLIFYGCQSREEFKERITSFCVEIFVPFCGQNYPDMAAKQQYFDQNRDTIIKEFESGKNATVAVVRLSDTTETKH